MLCELGRLNPVSLTCASWRNGRLTAVSEKLERGQSVDKAWKSHLWAWKSHFWEWNIHLGEWTNRGHPAECHLSLKGVQVKVAELKSTELNCATFSKTKGDSKRA